MMIAKSTDNRIISSTFFLAIFLSPQQKFAVIHVTRESSKLSHRERIYLRESGKVEGVFMSEEGSIMTRDEKITWCLLTIICSASYQFASLSLIAKAFGATVRGFLLA